MHIRILMNISLDFGRYMAVLMAKPKSGMLMSVLICTRKSSSLLINMLISMLHIWWL
jgi:hypothetical protein